MKVDFVVDGRPGAFERNGTTGRAVLRVGDESLTLQSPWNLLTHFDLSTTKTWKALLGGHAIVVIKERARMAGGLRDARFKVLVDGEEVAAQTGH